MVDDSLFPAKITFMLGFDVICVICLLSSPSIQIKYAKYSTFPFLYKTLFFHVSSVFFSYQRLLYYIFHFAFMQGEIMHV